MRDPRLMHPDPERLLAAALREDLCAFTEY